MTSNYRHLSQAQRYQIEALRAAGHTQSSIATLLGVHPSTISREIKRNSTMGMRPPERYRANNAQRFAQARHYRPPACKSGDAVLTDRLLAYLEEGWSPEQISGYCNKANVPMLSTEGIYLWMYNERMKGADYTQLLRRHHRTRRKRRLDRQPRVIIKDKVSIHDRPDAVALQQRCGDLETDLIQCKGGYVLTVTDRKTLFNVLTKLPDKRAVTIEEALVRSLLPWNTRLHTITSDNGTEFARHKAIASALTLDWFFADAYCSQQRGCNENQNGLIRQYLTRQTDLNDCSDEHIQWIQDKLNNRPRKKLDYQSPLNLFLQPADVALAN